MINVRKTTKSRMNRNVKICVSGIVSYMQLRSQQSFSHRFQRIFEPLVVSRGRVPIDNHRDTYTRKFGEEGRKRMVGSPYPFVRRDYNSCHAFLVSSEYTRCVQPSATCSMLINSIPRVFSFSNNGNRDTWDVCAYLFSFISKISCLE